MIGEIVSSGFDARKRIYMQLNFHGTINLTIMALIFSGCASFEPRLRYQDLMRLHQPNAKVSQKGLEISVEEFLSAGKSRKTFDADIARYGVLAIFLHAKNQDVVNYQLRQTQVKAFLGDQRLPALSGNDVARQAATREPVGKALAWTAATGPFAIILWPATIAGSGSHTHSVNKEIENYFENLEFGNVVVRPNHAIGGFLYFKLPDGVKKVEKLTLELIAFEENNTEQIEFRLSLPTINLGKAVSSPVARETDDDLQQ